MIISCFPQPDSDDEDEKKTEDIQSGVSEEEAAEYSLKMAFNRK